MTDVAVVGFAQSPCARHSDSTTSGVEMLVPIFHEVLAATGLAKDDIGFWCSGSSDYLAGRAFSFVQAVDAIGAFPPVMESHVEMDAAWALYEAWLKVLTGEAETALAYGFGKSSAGVLRRVLALQLDPYLLAPLWPDSVSIAALQARAGLDAGLWTEKEMAEVAVRSRAAARDNPGAQIAGEFCRRGPARRALRGRPAAGARLRAGQRRRGRGHPGRRGPGPRAVPAASLDHRVRAPGRLGRARRPRPDGRPVGHRRRPGRGRGRWRGHRRTARPVHPPGAPAPAGAGPGRGVRVNPSGGALCGNPMFAAGLARIGLAANEVINGRADRALGPRHQRARPAAEPGLRDGGTVVMKARA